MSLLARILSVIAPVLVVGWQKQMRRDISEAELLYKYEIFV